MQMIKEGSLDKAPRLSIRIVIWILPSDTVFVNSIKISANTETAMLSRCHPQDGDAILLHFLDAIKVNEERWPRRRAGCNDDIVFGGFRAGFGGE